MQLRAAALVIELGLRLRSELNIEARIAELERRVSEREQLDLHERV